MKFQTKTLGEIAYEMEIGELPKVSEQQKGTTPVIKYGDIVHQTSHFINECQTFLDDSKIRTRKTSYP